MRNWAMCFIFLIILLMIASPAMAKHPLYHCGLDVMKLTPELLEDLKLPLETQGVVICGVWKDFCADKAGLKEGDIIQKIDNKKVVRVLDLMPLFSERKSKPPVKKFQLTLLRGKEILTCEVAGKLQISAFEDWELTGRGIYYRQPEPRLEPMTITVSPDGSGDFKTVEGAVFNSRPKDTILLKEGIYPPFKAWRDEIIILGQGQDKVLIEAPVILSNVKNIVLKSVSIMGGKPGQSMEKPTAFGVVVSYSSVTIEDTAILRAVAGVYGVGSKSVDIRNSTLTNNSRFGVMLSGFEKADIIGNLIANNGFDEEPSPFYADVSGILDPAEWAVRGGISLLNTSGNKTSILANNTIVNNTAPDIVLVDALTRYWVHGCGIFSYSAYPLQIYNNIVAYNDVGIWLGKNGIGDFYVYNNNAFENKVSPKNEEGFLTTLKIRGGEWNYLWDVKKEHQMGEMMTFDPNEEWVWAEDMQVNESNLAVDPEFVNFEKGDYRLSNDSPCLNTGDEGVYMGAFAPEKD
ncbi:MAG: right-handed parallel beta-helix repeat-containing protein [Candidatus Omnitrophica bacterium]|nr:right-handed parallel beta-helix repeat-containing protein [Candidatus Omnitrophota bacterium]